MGGAPAQGSTGCGLDLPASDVSIDVAGMTASYLVDVPPDYDKQRPYPVILAFHGVNVVADQFRDYLGLPALAGTEAILIHPNCLNDAPAWDLQLDGMTFDALLTQTTNRYCIDEQRVFAVGHAAGGVFANSLGCTRAEKLRGIALLSPGPPPSSTCPAELAAWIIQGTADPAGFVGRGTRDMWGRTNHCDLNMPASVDPAPCLEYASCDPGRSVQYCEYFGDVDLPDFAATGLWNFFKSL